MLELTRLRWLAANAISLIVGLVIGKLSGGYVSAQIHRNNDWLDNVIAFGMDHLRLLSGFALIVLLAVIVKGRLAAREGLVTYFGIGVCIARIFQHF